MFSITGLTHHAVRTLGSLMSYVEEGTKARKTASTLQNPSSSRSHALLTIAVAEESQCVGNSVCSRKKEISPRGGSKLRLVDLAGSESAATCSGVHRLKVSHFLKIISLARTNEPIDRAFWAGRNRKATWSGFPFRMIRSYRMLLSSTNRNSMNWNVEKESNRWNNLFFVQMDSGNLKSLYQRKSVIYFTWNILPNSYAHPR